MRSQQGDRTGAAIRKLRLAKGWTLAELSSESGVPVSTLSRVELGQGGLNYDKLVRLCRALGVDLQGLVAKEADTAMAASGRRAVVRAGEGEPVKLAGNSGRRCGGDLLSKNFSPVMVDVTACSLEAHGPMLVVEAEAYVMVVEGEVVFHNHLYAPLPLRVGDGVYFDGRSGYALIAPEAPAKALLVAAGDQTFEI